ncbi:MAG TPA: BTAD domain-containing putative transcriptional regulator [Gemmatimonadaceae bacterium]|nr:BTAD domain-containing putative transcriptional regulator [Gemmatimonadaceae bacterium]
MIEPPKAPRVLLFGPADIAGSEDARRLIRQPKAFFLLAYLLVARPRGLQSRDRLVAMFWPDQDEARARGSLRATLHVLRESLGGDAVTREGDTHVGIDTKLISCDAIDFDSALAAGHLARALELYRGPLLDQLFGESAAADHWLDQEREHFRAAAADAAWTLASRYEADQNLTHAAKWARKAARLAGPDERRIRRIMTMLDAAGDRAGAILVYEEFGRFLSSTLDVEPSDETRALADAIRGATRQP